MSTIPPLSSANVDAKQRQFLYWLHDAFNAARGEKRTGLSISDESLAEAFKHSPKLVAHYQKVARWHIDVAENLLRKEFGGDLVELCSDFSRGMVEDLEEELLAPVEKVRGGTGDRPREGAPVSTSVLLYRIRDREGIIRTLILEKIPHAPGVSRAGELYPALPHAFIELDQDWRDAQGNAITGLARCGIQVSGFDVRWRIPVQCPTSFIGASAGGILGLGVGRFAGTGFWSDLDLSEVGVMAKINREGIFSSVGGQIEKSMAVFASLAEKEQGVISMLVVEQSSLRQIEDHYSASCRRDDGGRLFIGRHLVIGTSDLESAGRAIYEARYHSIWNQLSDPSEAPPELYEAYRKYIRYLRGKGTGDVLRRYPWFSSREKQENDFGEFFLAKCWEGNSKDPTSRQFVLLYPRVAAALIGEKKSTVATVLKKLSRSAELSLVDRLMAAHLAEVLPQPTPFLSGDSRKVEIQGIEVTLNLQFCPIPPGTGERGGLFLPSVWSGHFEKHPQFREGLAQIQQLLESGTCYLWTVTFDSPCDNEQWHRMGPELIKRLTEMVNEKNNRLSNFQKETLMGDALNKVREKFEGFRWTVKSVVSDYCLRRADLGQLEDTLDHAYSAVSVHGIHGAGGLGKTQLVRAFAREMLMQWSRDPETCRFRGGVIEVNLRAHNYGLGGEQDPLTPEEARAAILRDLGIDENTLDKERKAANYSSTALANYYRAELLKRDVLIILDNARDAAQVADLLPPAGSKSRAIVTSRQELDPIVGMMSTSLEGWRWADVMKYFESRNVFQGGIGSRQENILEKETLAKKICRLANGLPLAMKVIASFANSNTGLRNKPILDLVVNHLEGTSARKKVPGQKDEQSLKAVLDLCVNVLPGSMQHYYEALAVFPAHFDAAAAAAVWGSDSIEQAEAIIEDLVAKGLVNREASVELPVEENTYVVSLYRLHDRIREHAAVRANRRPGSAEQGQERELRFVAHYVGCQLLCQQILLQEDRYFSRLLGRSNVGVSHALFVNDALNFTSAFERLQKWLGKDSRALAILRLASFNGGVATRACDLFLPAPQRAARIAFAVRAAQKSIDLLGESISPEQLRELQREKAIHLNSLGLAYRHQALRDKADEHFKRVLRRDLAAAIESKERGAALGNAGNILQERFSDSKDRDEQIKLLRKSLKYHQEAEICSRAAGDDLAWAQDLGNQAIVVMNLWSLEAPGTGDETYEESLRLYQERIKIALWPQLNDQRGAGNGAGNRGTLFLKKATKPGTMGGFKIGTRAVLAYKAAIRYHRDGKNPRGVAANEGNLGRAYRLLASLSEHHRECLLSRALGRCEKSYKLFREVGDTEGVVKSLWNILAVCRHPHASACLTEKLEFYRSKLAEYSSNGVEEPESYAKLEDLAQVHLSDKYGKLSAIPMQANPAQRDGPREEVLVSLGLCRQLLQRSMQCVRPAKAADVDAIIQIVDQHARSTKTESQRNEEGFLITNYGKRYFDWLPFLSVAECAGKVVGFTLTFPSKDLPMEIDDARRFFQEAGGQSFSVIKQVGVERTWQGLGIGKALYRAEIKKSGAPIFVPVLCSNKRSMRFHASQRFVQICEYTMGPDDTRALWAWQ